MKAFTNTEEEEEEDGGENPIEPMETSTTTDVADAPFLERPEGQLLVSRILHDEKKSGSRKQSQLLLINHFLFMCCR